MTVLGLGPFIGEFKHEFLTFRPYARWLAEVIDFSNVYVSTHRNRSFMYDFVPKSNIIPVYEVFSRNEQGQKGYVHKDLQQKDFNLLVRKFRDDIVDRESCTKKDIEIHHLNYVKSTPHYSIYNKIFEEISTPDSINIPKEHHNKIVFIPATTEVLEKCSYIYSYLKQEQDCLVVGNIDTWFSNDNVVLSNIDYFENGWKYIVNYISKAKAVICPLSYWTALCNLQNKPVFSWGVSPGQYREGGVYYFGNKKSVVIPADIDTNPDIIIKMIQSFLNEIEKG
jgi:hypothetical protein